MIDDYELIPLNDTLPTYVGGDGRSSSNIDLIFVSARFCQFSRVEVVEETYSSNHYLVVADLDLSPKLTKSFTNRLNLKKVDWTECCTRIDSFIDTLELNLKEHNQPLEVYKLFIDNIIQSLMDSGTYFPSCIKGLRKSQPLWWDEECDRALVRRRDARKEFIRMQTNLNRIRFNEIDNEVKWFLRNKKKTAYVEFCNKINPSMGMKHIWARVKAFATALQPLRTGITNDPDSEVFLRLQRELVQEDVRPTLLPFLKDFNSDSTINSPFSESEYYNALNSIKKNTLPGLDSITYHILKKLPAKSKQFLLILFNTFFVESTFPETWRDTRVVFLPKPLGKGYRPISLTSNICKLFERIVQKRLEHHVEYVDGIPMNQFGFRRGRSTTDCVSVFVADVTRGFVNREHTFALAVDLKGAFSNILPQPIHNRLIELRVPGRIVNFISFLTTIKHLHFDSEGKDFKDSYIGVPQGGVLSPLLFNLALSRIGEVIPGGVKWLMFADDLLLYITSKDLQFSLRLLEKAITDLTPWLAEVGLSISSGKSQLTIFSRTNENFENCFIEIEDTVVTTQTDLTYLGIILDKRLSWQKHIKAISQKATKTFNLIKSMTRISWGASPSSLLTVFKGLTRTHLEWSSQFFADSAQSNLGPLDRIQNQSLRIILGCMRSTPIGILMSESNIPPHYPYAELLSTGDT